MLKINSYSVIKVQIDLKRQHKAKSVNMWKILINYSKDLEANYASYITLFWGL